MYHYNTKGIYIVTNKKNGKFYIGQSKVAVGVRKVHHLVHLRRNIHYCKDWQEDFNKYGEDAFEWDVLEEVNDLSKLDEREIYWIDKMDAIHKGYNQCSGGKGAPRKLSFRRSKKGNRREK